MSKKKVVTVSGTSLGDAKMPSLRDKLNKIETPVAPVPEKAKGKAVKVGKSK